MSRLWNLFRNRTSRTVVVQNRWKTFWSNAGHFIALGSIVTLMYFLAAEFFIGSELAGPSGQDSLKFLALQATAKALELLVVASFQTMLSTLNCLDLISDDGAPLSTISATGRIADPSFLWSRDFRSLFGSGVLSTWRRVRNVAMLITCTILAIFVAPTFAFAVTPQLGVWPVGGTNMFFNDTLDNIFPPVLDSSHVVGNICVIAGSYSRCPSAGWDAIKISYLSHLPDRFAVDKLPRLPLKSVLVRGRQSLVAMNIGIRDHFSSGLQKPILQSTVTWL
ncbi:hypothetical protein F4801DRAFT_550287 [Xylaria longipes]|nr:hypothetical protein F4801DRAFT_550287 [Xylaria longipes]